MSSLSHNIVEDINKIYSSINENFELLDEETKEFVEDIISTITVSMLYEGYSIGAILDFLSHSSDEEIIEKYLDFNKNIIYESVISEEYVLEQLEILDEVLGSVGSGLGILARSLFGAGARRTLSVSARRAMGPGARKAMANASTKIKDIASKTKAALTGPTAKKVALGAAGLGAAGATGAAGGYIGAKMAGAGGDTKPSQTSKPSDSGVVKDLAAYTAGGGGAKSKETGMSAREIEELGRKNLAKKPAAPASAAPAAPSGSGGGGGSSPSPAPKSSTPAKPSDTADSKLTDMQKWAKANPNLAAKVKVGQSGYDEISQMRDKPGPNEKQDQTPTTGPEATEAQKSEAGKDVMAQLEREQEKMKRKQKEDKIKNDTSTTTSENYDAYDIILNYLFENGHVDTLDEAHYVMMEMDVETVGSICEAIKN